MARSRFPKTPQEENIDPEILQAIGLLVATASAVDMQAGMQIIRLISPINFMSFHAMPVVMGMEFKVKTQLLKILLASYSADETGELTKLCDRMRELYTRRNEIAHAVMVPDKKPGQAKFQLLKAEAKTGFMIPAKILGTEQIRNWGRELLICSFKLEQALTELGYPNNMPTEDDVGVRQSAISTAPPADRKSHARKPKRRKHPQRRKAPQAG
jgi:hypothetical protein